MINVVKGAVSNERCGWCGVTRTTVERRAQNVPQQLGNSAALSDQTSTLLELTTAGLARCRAIPISFCRRSGDQKEDEEEDTSSSHQGAQRRAAWRRASRQQERQRERERKQAQKAQYGIRYRGSLSTRRGTTKEAIERVLVYRYQRIGAPHD